MKTNLPEVKEVHGLFLQMVLLVPLELRLDGSIILFTMTLRAFVVRFLTCPAGFG